jgi:tetratricopeptide (TPR) repeat protein
MSERTAVPRWRALCSSLTLIALLAACSNVPNTPGAAVGKDATHSAFEQQELDRAKLMSRQNRLAEAAQSWEVLTVLRPDVPSYAERLASTRAQMARSAADLAVSARQAFKRGALDEAAQQYLALLALQPGDTAAADALRAIERERNKRDFLGRYSRLTLAGRMSGGATLSDGAAANALSAERNDLEHAAMLAGQGEYDDAIALLSPRLKSRVKDEAARSLLADVYFQKAQADVSGNKAAVISLLDKCLQLNPKHAGARARLAQLKPAAPPRKAAAGAGLTSAP